MGACDDSFEAKGSLTESELTKKFNEYVDMCDSENGRSYSGRLNMCTGLTIHNKTFNTFNEAWEYLFGANGKAVKWEDAVAVKYKVQNPVKDNAQLTKLKAQRAKLRGDLAVIQNEITNVVSEKLKSVEFITCTGCKSRMDTRFRIHGLKCPICSGSFAPRMLQHKRRTLETKINALEKKITDTYQVLQDKADKSDNREVRWLVGGLCSS